LTATRAPRFSFICLRGVVVSSESYWFRVREWH